MHYELWDLATGNLLDDFAAEGEAFDAIASLFALDEGALTGKLTLLRIDDAVGDSVVADGQELVRRARAARMSA